MGLDVRRHIEVCTEDIVESYQEIELNKIGNLGVGDVILIYNTEDLGSNYMEIIGINATGPDSDDYEFVYKPIKLPTDVKEFLNYKMPKISMRIENLRQLPIRNRTFNNGDIIRIWHNCGKKYYIKTNEGWKETNDVPTSWKPIEYINADGEKTTAIDDVRGAFVDNYLHTNWECKNDKFINRGLPEDISEAVKNNISKFEFDYTYITLDEIDSIISNEQEILKNNLYKCINEKKLALIDEKLDWIIQESIKHHSGRCKFSEKSKDDEDIDSYEEVFEDNIYVLISAYNEMSLASTLAQNIKKVYSQKNIRIIYAFNN